MQQKLKTQKFGVSTYSISAYLVSRNHAYSYDGLCR
jgi:hypothetical protein